MGELIRWEAAAKPLPFSGERLTGAVAGHQVEIEHYHRYLLARDFCRDRDVLDVASGEGYGTALLAQVARSAIGIEIDAAAVAVARSEFRQPHLRYEQGDARALPLADGSVDVAVSFETLEHILEHETFIGELHRVLRPGGLLIMSSPDRDIYSSPGTPPNPYHVLELTKAEFEALLHRHFKHANLAVQRAIIGSLTLSSAQDIAPRVFDRRGATHVEASNHLSRAPYIIALASDGDLPPLPNSVYVHRSDLDTEMDLRVRAETQAHDIEAQGVAAERRAAEATQLAQAAASRLEEAERLLAEARQRAATDRDELVARHQTTLAERDKQLAALQAALVRQGDEIGALRAATARSEQRLQAVLSSTSWRLTKFPRRLGSRYPRLARTLGRAVKLAWRTVTLQHLGRWRAWQTMRRRRLEPATHPTSDSPKTTIQPEPRHALRDIDPAAANWFFIGDTLEWLQAHESLTGVGKVTVELFFASLDADTASDLPCVLSDDGGTLVAISPWETISILAEKVGRHPSQARSGGTGLAPRRGDHVLFTGVVWTRNYRDLFGRLSEDGIRFSVLVHDIIPIELPQLVGHRNYEIFADWLATVVARAHVVFVSSAIVKDQILRWAILSGISVNASIVPIRFGSAAVEPAIPPENLKAKAATSRVRLSSFVLSVGTIDTRKNQILLCRAWAQLVCDLGDVKVPQLVLVGRDDLAIARLDETIASLITAEKVVVLQGITDQELASLYRASLFTVFPSLSEGYGLPVAESLLYGKLCICSDLPVIREHAGDLPWYFAPGDAAGAYRLLREAIENTEARTNVEARITQLYRAYSWASTYETMREAIAERATARGGIDPAPASLRPLAIPGLAAPVLPAALADSQAWCTDVDPDVSIIVINWNAAYLTLECVRHIWANTSDVRYEIIVVDNGSGLEHIQPLWSLGRGTRLIELGVNRFFGEANNIGVEAARGRYVCFLNNDAFVRPGWLGALVRALEQTPDAGAVGPLFLFPDNTIQEAGAVMDEHGFPIRFGRGQGLDATGFLVRRSVDYISAATLLMSRDLFLMAGGFDLAYEPAYYEDADLCFKIRTFGKHVYYCPDARVLHIEGAAANDDPVAVVRRNALGDLNRGKFTARWGAYLKSRSEPDLQRAAAALGLRAAGSGVHRVPARAGLKTAAVFTPFVLTPGGGERYLLTLASVLTESYDVSIVTPYRYSRLRLLDLGREFSVDLSSCGIMTEDDLLAGPRPDLLVTVGNHIIPPIAACAKDNLFICQFPFTLSANEISAQKGRLSGYRAVMTYSEYCRTHIRALFSEFRLPTVPVEVIYPPVPPMAGSAARKKNAILSVGRFFAGGHSKRHDTMIRAFRDLLERVDGDLELHLAGSSMPTPEHMDYLRELRKTADGLPVSFHVNVLPERLSELYRDAMIYWHATGLEANLERRPEKAEHFGITIIEAMSAECLVMALNAGGPRELIEHGVSGFLYRSVDELQELTLAALEEGFADRRRTIGAAARARAANFAPDNFARRIREFALGPVEQRAVSAGVL